MKIYVLKTCDTCRNAVKELKAAGHAPEVVDVREEGVPEAVLAAAHDRFGAALVNRRSTTWRGLDDAERAAPAVPLLRGHPTLMKRPLVVSGDEMTLGWDAAARERWLGG
ncbi:arsenate reductase [Roseovarius sp. SCSIO 43702]|uniref:arsenate reductase family protein n=1 Tax=Roseovarius sp. SCSIO 43702 TaxID=2823043 RepID=UPI001C730220|nr:ArsC/Spx/MgsR family protein [Roseovarius sp. SCSIO 43702]QYX55768.1 arsenate reductase [Roseovarius sp. SCSIO 43702]